jgi:hypothetical protein
MPTCLRFDRCWINVPNTGHTIQHSKSQVTRILTHQRAVYPVLAPTLCRRTYGMLSLSPIAKSKLKIATWGLKDEPLFISSKYLSIALRVDMKHGCFQVLRCGKRFLLLCHFHWKKLLAHIMSHAPGLGGARNPKSTLPVSATVATSPSS